MNHETSALLHMEGSTTNESSPFLFEVPRGRKILSAISPAETPRDHRAMQRHVELKIRLDSIILPNCKETTTSSIKLRFDESSRTNLTGLSVLLRNAIFIFTLMSPAGSILGRRHRFRVRP